MSSNPQETAALRLNTWHQGRYRKKPVVIEAIEWTGQNIEQVLRFCYTDDRWKQGIESEYVGGPGIGHVPPLGELTIPGTRELGPSRQLSARGVHERRDLDRVADLNTALAASYRRAFIGVTR